MGEARGGLAHALSELGDCALVAPGGELLQLLLRLLKLRNNACQVVVVNGYVAIGKHERFGDRRAFLRDRSLFVGECFLLGAERLLLFLQGGLLVE